MFLIICYDTPSNRRRRRLARRLKDALVRVQKSVFEGPLPSRHLKPLIAKLETLVDPKEDSLRIYTIPEDFVPRILAYGQPGLTLIDPVLLIGSGDNGSAEENEPGKER